MCFVFCWISCFSNPSLWLLFWCFPPCLPVLLSRVWGGCGGVKPLCQRKWGFSYRELLLWAVAGDARLLWAMRSGTAVPKGVGLQELKWSYRHPDRAHRQPGTDSPSAPELPRHGIPQQWGGSVWEGKCKGNVSGFKQSWMVAKVSSSLCSAPLLFFEEDNGMWVIVLVCFLQKHFLYPFMMLKLWWVTQMVEKRGTAELLLFVKWHITGEGEGNRKLKYCSLSSWCFTCFLLHGADFCFL